MEDIIDLIKRAYPSKHALTDHFQKTEAEAKALAEKKGDNGVFAANLTMTNIWDLFLYILTRPENRKKLLAWLVGNDTNKLVLNHHFSHFVGWSVSVDETDLSECYTIIVVLAKKGDGFRCVTMYPVTGQDAGVCGADKLVSEDFLLSCKKFRKLLTES